MYPYCASAFSGVCYEVSERPVTCCTPVFKQTLREHLEKTFPSHELTRWYDPLDLEVDENEQVIRVHFPHTFFAEWFMTTARPLFEQEVSVVSPKTPIVYANGSCGANAKPTRPLAYKTTEQGRATPERAINQQEQAEPGSCVLSGFLVNKKNDFPLAAARESVEKAVNPPYTPFVIYGYSGVGKTHILVSMANAVREKRHTCRYADVSFLERSILSPGRFSLMPEQCVFLDDVQRIAELPELQDVLVAAIDAFSSSGRLLALSFDAHPSTYAGIGHKLKSRLMAGLIVEIKKPDLDIRRQYVQLKNESGGLGLKKEDMLALAQRYQDIRGIDGALTRLAAYRNLMSEKDAEARKQDISAILSRGAEQKVLTPQHIILAVGRNMSVSPEDIVGKSRDKKITLARHLAIVLCRELLGVSLVQAGRIFGGRDHSSIVYSIKKIKELQSSNKDMHKKLEELRKECLTSH